MARKNDDKKPTRVGRRPIFTKAAGWVLAGLGAVHIAVAVYDTRDTWNAVAAEGWWDTFTLDRAVSVDGLLRSEAFWVTAGSFGVPLGVLGGSILWSVSHDRRVPAGLGWALLAYGLSAAIILPRSPIWVVALAGALVVLGESRRQLPTRRWLRG